MKLEHFALNVAAPREMASWYVKNFQMSIARELGAPTYTHFLADETGQSVLEIYLNPADQVPDYAQMNPLLVHIAFASPDPTSDSQRLIAAGATFVEELHLPDGSHLMMLRDPWGLALQLCKRGAALL